MNRIKLRRYGSILLFPASASVVLLSLKAPINPRAFLAGISFGDQAQFFRRAALPEGFPDYRLMEEEVK